MSEKRRCHGFGVGLAGRPTYAFEGLINFSAATIEWLKNQLGLIHSALRLRKLATSVPDNGGVYLVPAFAGLSAPYWSPDARAAIVEYDGVHEARTHRARGAGSNRLSDPRRLDMMRGDAKVKLKTLHADGGPTRNNFLMQFTADLTRTEIKVAEVAESSASGAAMSGLLGLASKMLTELTALPQAQTYSTPG